MAAEENGRNFTTDHKKQEEEMLKKTLINERNKLIAIKKKIVQDYSLNMEIKQFSKLSSSVHHGLT